MGARRTDVVAAPQASWRGLLVPLAISVIAFVFWNTIFVYPLKIFVVFLHEISHGLAAIATGGSIDHIELNAQQGGVCFTRGGSRFVTLSAGYLGSFLWGALFLVLAFRTRWDRLIVGSVGLFTLFVTLVYVRSGFGLLYGLAAGAVLVAVAWKLPAGASDMLLRVIGVVSCLYAVWDIVSDLVLRSVPESDANALARLTGIPGIVWGIVWTVLALSVMLGAVRVAMASRVSRVSKVR